jgi:hypothetical protein
VRLTNNSRQDRQSKLRIGCRPFPWYSIHPFPKMDYSHYETEAFGSHAAPVPILIANTRLKFALRYRDVSGLQISNRERMAIFRRSFSIPSSFKPPASSVQNLIVTLELKFPATRTKQTRNQNPNRYKMAVFHPGCSSGTRVSHPESICGLPPSAHAAHGPSASCIPRAPRLTWRRESHPLTRRSVDTCDPVGINWHSC